TLSVGGTVSGLITDQNAQPVSAAHVTITASNGTFTVTTGADGSYSLDHVAPGPVAVLAQDSTNSFAGQASGTLTFAGQTLVLNIKVTASGIVTGTIFRSDGITAVGNAQVTISGSAGGTTVSDAQGHYTFNFVPLGSFTISATDPVTGDRGSNTNQENMAGEVRTVNVIMVGV